MNAPTPSTAGPEQRPELAMSLMLVAMLILPGIDAIAKWLSDSISAGQIAWSRFLFQTILMLPLFLQLIALSAVFLAIAVAIRLP